MKAAYNRQPFVYMYSLIFLKFVTKCPPFLSKKHHLLNIQLI